ncbi:MAG: type II secretion system protein [Phycisphaerales bacterium]
MRGRCAKRDAFTLLEMVIVLTLLVSVSAIMLPTLFTRSDKTAWREARAGLEASVVLAQSEARLAGRVYRVEADAGDPCVVRLAPMPDADDDSAGADERAPRAKQPGRFLAALPDGCTLAIADNDERARPEQDASGAALLARETASDNAPVLLGWAMPDGAFIASEGVRLTLGEHVGDVTIDRWSGRVTLTEPQAVESSASPTAVAMEGEAP